MLQARIVSNQGSLYFAAEATPYDLENLRTHIRDFQTMRGSNVRLELSLDRAGPNDTMSMQVSAWLRRLAADGVQVSVCPAAALSGRTSAARAQSRR
jgi:uncharacterized membrane protein